MKKILLLLIFPCLIYSQEIKTYNGKYQDGLAEYQYFENENLERIYQGKFEYSNIEKTNSSKGSFIQNMKNGDWFYKKEEYPYGKTECNGNYINDKKNGIWTYKFKYDKKNDTYKAIYQVNFRNDTIIGNVNLKDIRNHISLSDVIEFECKLDEKSRINGLFKVFNTSSDQKNEEIIEFYKGILVKRINKDNETGQFITKYIPNKDKIINIIDSIEKNQTNNFKLEFVSYNNYYKLSRMLKVTFEEIFRICRISGQKGINTNDSFYIGYPSELYEKVNTGSVFSNYKIYDTN